MVKTTQTVRVDRKWLGQKKDELEIGEENDQDSVEILDFISLDGELQ